MLLSALREMWPWKEIRNCPGRFVVSKSGDDVPPDRVLELIREKTGGNEVRTRFFPRGPEQDDVFVAVFLDGEGGGLITFCKKPPRAGFVHTLNEPEGLERKLRGLGFFDDLMRDLSAMSSQGGA